MVDARARNVSQRARYRATIIPALIAVVVVVFWGADLSIKGNLNWAQATWLLIVAASVALLSLPLVVPLTLALDWAARAMGAGEVGRYTVYAVSFAAIGASIGFATDVIGFFAALLAGVVAGILAAKACEASVTAGKESKQV